MTNQLNENAVETGSELDAANAEVARRTSAGATPPRPEVEIKNADAVVCYANICRVTGTPEELILDFGLNSQAMGAATQIEIKQRLVVSYFTAKRLLQALGLSIQRHEAAFGVLETDVQKRITPALRRAAIPG